MKNIHRLYTWLAVILLITACTDLDTEDFKVEKPLSIELQEEIDAYDALKSYIGDLNLGAGVSSGTYEGQGVPYRLINSNFNEITFASGMNHADLVQADGTLRVEATEDLLKMATDAGLSVFGHALTWHMNQNAEFLNSTIAPLVIPATGGPVWEEKTAADFETNDASNYLVNGGTEMTFTADGEGANGEGRALKVTNPTVRDNDWQSQFFVSFEPQTQVGEMWELTMDVRADVDATMATQAQVVPYEYKHWNFFGAITATTEWNTITVQITVTAETSGCGAIAFNLGNTATSYYFDNISVKKFNEEGGGGPAWEALSANDFETDDASNYLGNANAVMSFTAAGEGANGDGRALKISNSEVRANDWDSQFFITFSPNTELGQRYRLTMDVKADDAVTFPTQAHVVPYQYQHWNFFGQISATPEWTTISVEITADANTAGVGAIAFNLGATATNYYFDNFEVAWLNEDAGGEQIIEKTPEEKRDTLTIELENWISGVMGASKDQVNAWNVVNEPLDDADPDLLKSGEGMELGDNEFYWQDYLGKDYGVLAFNLAREYGKETDVLFINEYGLEANLDKCQALINYVEYIEAEGATVDGIGTQMHLTLDSDKDNIAQMFTLLAATGKMIKVSELNVAIMEEPTQELLEMQADMYKYVVDTYLAEVPAAQRFGVTIWNPTDGSTRQGLWTSDFTRKPAYAAFAEAFKGGL